MRIGFDFDNTIVRYDRLFHQVANEQGLVDDTVPVNKLAVRDHLRQLNKEDIWTEMQGYVYGARMSDAQIYPHVFEVITKMKSQGHVLAIVSHKTKHPYLGKQYDLHASARLWIRENLYNQGVALIPDDHVFFEVTKEDKLARIADFGCDVYIDDLPEILLAPNFPKETQRFLFDPEEQHLNKQLIDVKTVSTWKKFASYLI